MITLDELLGDDEDFSSLLEETQKNLNVLLLRINIIRDLYGKPMQVTSGLRSMRHHLEVYAAKGITDKSKIPLKSKHLFGQAVDIYDPKNELKAWVLLNVPELEKVGLWCEDFSATKNWVHFQIVPPKSGNRFFMP